MAELFDDILAGAKAQIAALQADDKAMDADIAAIKNKAFETPLTKTDRDTIAQLRAKKIAVLGAIEQLALVTLVNLDKTEEILRLANALAAITADLKQKAAALEAIGAKVKSIGATLDDMSGLATKLKKLATDKPKKK